MTEQSKYESYDQLSKIVWENPRFQEIMRKRQEECGNLKELSTDDPDWFEGLLVHIIYYSIINNLH